MLNCVSSCTAIIDNQQLLLFCVPTNKDISPIPQCIASTDPFILQLTEVLPSHGIPDRVYWISSLPQTLHGKLDREGLLHVAKSVGGVVGAEIEMSGDVHRKLRQLWKVLLSDIRQFIIYNANKQYW